MKELQHVFPCKCLPSPVSGWTFHLLWHWRKTCVDCSVVSSMFAEEQQSLVLPNGGWRKRGQKAGVARRRWSFKQVHTLKRHPKQFFSYILHPGTVEGLLKDLVSCRRHLRWKSHLQNTFQKWIIFSLWWTNHCIPGRRKVLFLHETSCESCSPTEYDLVVQNFLMGVIHLKKVRYRCIVNGPSGFVFCLISTSARKLH